MNVYSRANLHTKTFAQGYYSDLENSLVAIFRFTLVLSVLLFVSSLAYKVYVTNRLAVKGFQMRELITNHQLLEKDISALKLQASTVSSLQAIEQRAHVLGFVEMKDPVEVIRSHPIAVLPTF